MKRFNRLLEAFYLSLRSVDVYQKVLTTGRAIFTDVVHSEYSLHLCCMSVNVKELI